MTPLVLVCGLFASFVAIQFAYLFGGNARVQEIPGLTYAAYARQGFAELVTVAVLTLGVATLWQRLLRRENAAQERGFQAVTTLLTLLTLVLLASAYQRMSVYEAAYGETAMRLYVDTFIAGLGIVLLWFTLTLWAGWQRFFAFGALLCGLGCLAWMNVQNPDDAVARTSVARALAGKQSLEEWTLRSMSNDAIPALCDGLDRLRGADQQALITALSTRLGDLEAQRRQTRWPSWNVSRQRAYRALKAHAAPLNAGHPAQNAPAKTEEGHCGCG